MEHPMIWGFIDSNCGIYTELIKNLGVKGAQVETIWSLEEKTLDLLRPIHGIILTWNKIHNEEPSKHIVKDHRLENIYFAQQSKLASTTVGLLNALFNCDHPDISLGHELTNVKNYTIPYDPKTRGQALITSEIVTNAHNSVCVPLYDKDPPPITYQLDTYDFTVYMPIDDRLYELDDRREGPIDHGPIAPGQDWLDYMRDVVLTRITKFMHYNERYSMMALISDKITKYEKEIDELIDETIETEIITKKTRDEILFRQMLVHFEKLKKKKCKEELQKKRVKYGFFSNPN